MQIDKTSLVFVYNAESGLFNTLTDIAHKMFSPETYGCNLCAITHSNFGMRQEWKEFLDNLEVPFEFLHADELRAKYKIEDVSLPVIFKKQDESLEVLIDSRQINACRSIDDLRDVISASLDDPAI